MGRKKRNANRKTKQSRRTAFRDPKERFLIFCEGKNTEPEYFKAFKLVTASIKTIHMNQGDALSIVKEAIIQKRFSPDYDQYWLVFDKDESTNERFNNAIKQAEDKGFKVAYSNQAFEYWYLLHFKKYNGLMHRGGYASKLQSHLGFKYDKRLLTSKKMFELLLPFQLKALKNAESIYKSFGESRNPAEEESSTTVFKLVHELNKYI